MPTDLVGVLGPCPITTVPQEAPNPTGAPLPETVPIGAGIPLGPPLLGAQTILDRHPLKGVPTIPDRHPPKGVPTIPHRPVGVPVVVQEVPGAQEAPAAEVVQETINLSGKSI